MKLHTVAALAVAVVAGGMGLSSNAWAGGAGGGNLSCLVDQAKPLGPAVHGTVAIQGVFTGGGFNLDAILRLEYHGKEQIFRASVPNAQVVTDAGTACDLLQAETLGGGGPRNGDGQTIQEAFGFPVDAVLKLNNRSITGVDWINPVPGTGDNMTIVEVRIYPIPRR